MKGWSSRVTIDIFGVTSMDYDFSSLQNPESTLIKAYNELFIPPTKSFRFFEELARLFGPDLVYGMPLKYNKTLQENKGTVLRIASDIIEQRRREEFQNDLLGLMLHHETDFSRLGILDHIMCFLAAGHETTAGILQWIIVELCKRPDIQDRVHADIHAMLPKNCFPLSSSFNSGLQVTADMINELPYIKAVCNEAIRCHAPMPQSSRISEHSDQYLGGTFLPQGTRIWIPTHAISYDPKLWGPDAAEFNPDRWMAPLQSTNGGASSAYAHMTFLHGPHFCPGQDVTKVELYVLTACLFGSFKFRHAYPDQEIKFQQGITLTPAGGVPVYLTKVVE